MKKKTKLLIFFILIGITGLYKAQKNRGVAIGHDNTVPSAILDVHSSNLLERGSGATAVATVNAAGQVTGVTVTNGGKNYTGIVKVNIYGTGSTFLIANGAKATATVTNGVITGITVTNGGSKYEAGKTLVSINSGHKAVVLPRVDLVSITNGTTPVNNPKDGLVVYNNPKGAEKSGIYFWNPSYPKWDRGVAYIETPKGALIEFSGTDKLILDNALAGSYFAVSSDVTTNGDIYLYNPAATLMGLRSVNLDLSLVTGPTPLAIQNGVYGKAYCINVEPGSYKFEMTFYFTVPPPDPGYGIQINGNSGYYYMGYLMDTYLVEYDIATQIPTAVQPASPPAPLSPIDTRFRKEYGVISKVDSEHRMTQIYSYNVPEPSAGKAYALFVRLGRMSGSGLNDQFSFSRARSYFKVNKY